MKRVFIERVANEQSSIERAMTFLDWERLVPSQARVFLKPNLTWKEHLPGVTTRPMFIEAVVRALKERTDRITIGEGEGGYNAYRAEEAFQNHGLYDLTRRYGVTVANLSRERRERLSGEIAGRETSVELPVSLLHETDCFITLPVPKIHAMTVVSLGFKNQWGCIPNEMRIREHSEFAYKVLLLHRALRPKLALFDAKYILDRTGPMVGVPIAMNLLLASDDVGAGSLACCQVMQIDPMRVKHFRLALGEGFFPHSASDLECNQPLEPFCSHQFLLDRSVVNWLALAAFHSSVITRLAYDLGFRGRDPRGVVSHPPDWPGPQGTVWQHRPAGRRGAEELRSQEPCES